MNNTIKIISGIRELVANHNVNSKREKHRRHTPFSPNNFIQYDKSVLEDSLRLQIGNGTPTEFFNIQYDKPYPNSFSLSEKTLDEHRVYIDKKLGEMIDIIKSSLLSQYDTYQEKELLFRNDFYEDVTDEFKDVKGRVMYSKAYKLNIFPPFSFYQEASLPTMIATAYIIAIDKGDKNLNIFFSGKKTFDRMLDAERTLQEQIYNFNSRNQNISISREIWIIYYNLLGTFGGYHTMDGRVYTKKIVEIDKPPYIFENNGLGSFVLCGFGWDVFDFILENIKIRVETTNNEVLNFSMDKHPIKDERNKKLLHIQ